jgi:SAM-dependent methyltransferase
VAGTHGDIADWERVAPEYVRALDEIGNVAIQSEVRGGIWSMLGEVAGRRVLDVGCGQGWLAAELVAAGASVTGVDGSPTLLKEAGRVCPGGRFLEHDLLTGLPDLEGGSTWPSPRWC